MARQTMSSRPSQIAPVYTEQACGERLKYLALSQKDRALLEEMHPLITEHLPTIVEQFYQALLATDATRTVFQDEAMVDRLKVAQQAYLLSSLSGTYDPTYFAERWAIGRMHYQIKVEPHWFIGAFQIYHRIIYPLLLGRYGGDSASLVEHILALDKVMNLDLQLGIESYVAEHWGAMAQIESANQRIREASAAKSQFLANMSHEFRTPLNAIIGFAEVLQDRSAGPLTEEQSEYLQEIHSAGQLLLRLINDVLDLAKIEAGRLELIYENVPIGQVIREAVTMLKPLARKKGLYVDMELPSTLGLIAVDQTRFKQILWNLLANAVKFTESGGITIAATRNPSELHISIRDTGIGIRPDDHAKIFEEFSQVNGSHTTKFQGTGLGLAVSRRLAEAHGGRIRVDSEYGQGSIFHLEIPLTAAEPSVDGAAL